MAYIRVNGEENSRRRLWIKNSLFRQFLVIVILLLCCMAGSYALTNRIVKNLIRKNTEISNEKILNQINAKTSEFHNSIYNILTLLAYEQTAYDYFSQDRLDRLNEYENLLSLLSNTMMIQNDIAGITLYDEQKNMLAGVGKDFDMFARIELVSKLTYSNVFRPNSTSEAYFMVFYPVYDLLNGNYDKRLGMIVFLMKASKFSSYLADSAITENEQLFLIDRNNVVIAGDGEQEFRHLEEENLESTQDRFIQAVDQKETGWRIVSIIPVRELYSGMTIVRGSILVIYLFTLGGLVLLLFFCYFIIIRPIRRVDLFVKNNVAYPTRRLTVEGTDEISVLAGNLNHMLDEKDEMSEQLRQSQRILYETELTKHQMQLLAYRNQINPHFLYNTFECIRAMALYYDADEIAEITMALSRIFRYSIKGENVVTVSEEMENIREYAKIIHYRFGGRIRVDIQMEKEAEDMELIKLILQPIVENSIFHGLEQKLEDGRVTVKAECYQETRLRFTVEDDGCGMEQEAVDKLMYQMKRQSLHRSSSKDSIGLANIYQRLQLYYGESAVFRMNSTPGKGTKVEIIIPYRIPGKGI